MVTFKCASNFADMIDVFALRIQVFCKEKKSSLAYELDYNDENLTIHFILRVDGETVGTVRVIRSNEYYRLSHLAVLKTYRKKGYGRILLERAIKYVKERKASYLSLICLPTQVRFFKKFGFEESGFFYTASNDINKKMRLIFEN